jgi:hypothetical protein
MPHDDLKKILNIAYYPCPGFHGACSSMRWEPSIGHVPRGYFGAHGDLKEVRAVIVFAEPGDPLPEESYSNLDPAHIEEAATSLLKFRDAAFHSNVRLLLECIVPEAPLAEKLKYVWATNAVLCSALKVSGNVPRDIESECAKRYLEAQLDLFPYAKIIAVGKKAERRLKLLNRSSTCVYHPSSRVGKAKIRESYSSLTRLFSAKPR